MLNLLAIKLSMAAIAFGAPCNPNTDNPPSPFFAFPHWWKYITNGTGDASGTCTPALDFSKGPIEALAIGLAAIDILLYLAGIVAVISIIISGITLITSTGSTDKSTAARRRLQNALIGLAIVFIASAAVSFIGNSLT